MKNKHQHYYLKKKTALKCSKLLLHDAILTSGAPRPGVPAERFYQKHQFLAKNDFCSPDFKLFRFNFPTPLKLRVCMDLVVRGFLYVIQF